MVGCSILKSSIAYFRLSSDLIESSLYERYVDKEQLQSLAQANPIRLAKSYSRIRRSVRCTQSTEYEIADKGLALRAPYAVQQSSCNDTSILGLSLLTGYQCLLPNCNQA